MSGTLPDIPAGTPPKPKPKPKPNPTRYNMETNQPADIILINGKIITVDQDFSVTQAVAISGNRIALAGSSDHIGKLSGDDTLMIDLKGKTVIPGIIEGHLHPETAAFSEMDEDIPHITDIGKLLEWIRDQASVKKRGEWIIHPKFFYTRMRELRQPTLAELDAAAPHHLVFLDGTYGGMVNTRAMKHSSFAGAGHPGIAYDENGRPTGFLKASAFGLLNRPPVRQPAYKDKLHALRVLLQKYNRYAITSLCSGWYDPETTRMYHDLRSSNSLTARIMQHVIFPAQSGVLSREMVLESLKELGTVTGSGDEWIRTGALKVLLDGGILTGTAFLREPWGEKAYDLFGFKDPDYRGILNYRYEDLVPVVSAANELGWSFTAHCTGGGGVDLLLDVYEHVNKEIPVKERRFSIIHGNFFTPESIVRMKELGIYASMQPAWFYKDADAMKYILGDERIKNFHPYNSLVNAGVMVNGGSDHMVKLDANTSINPYNPFLAIWTMVTRTTERGSVIMPAEAVTREDALRMYTINNAYASFEEALKGSIEPGKLADMAVLSEDILTCPVDRIKDIESELTILDGKIVYSGGTIFN